MPTETEIHAAAKMLCFMNGQPECNGYPKEAGPPCTPETCLYGVRDFTEEARAALEAAEKVRQLCPNCECGVCEIARKADTRKICSETSRGPLGLD